MMSAFRPLRGNTGNSRNSPIADMPLRAASLMVAQDRSGSISFGAVRNCTKVNTPCTSTMLSERGHNRHRRLRVLRVGA
jgi:hypothetical protein